MDYIDELTLEDLDEEQQELAEVLGFDSYKNLIKTYGGTSIYVLKKETVCRVVRNRIIRDNFDGDYKKIARKHKLSDRQIREIIDKR